MTISKPIRKPSPRIEGLRGGVDSLLNAPVPPPEPDQLKVLSIFVEACEVINGS